MTLRCPLCGRAVENTDHDGPGLEDGRDLVERVRLALALRLPRQEASLITIAATLNVSPRTLQKRLQERETSFKALMDEVRLELAKEYLEREDASLVGVAFLLGYSELSAFVRAFSRWTGETPGEYRRHVREKRRKHL